MLADQTTIWLALAGICAFLSGAPRAGLILVAPAIFYVSLSQSIQTVRPLIGDASASYLFILGLTAVITCFILVLGGIWLIQTIIRAMFGEIAAGFVTGIYLVRFFDFVGSAFLILFIFGLLLSIAAVFLFCPLLR